MNRGIPGECPDISIAGTCLGLVGSTPVRNRNTELHNVHPESHRMGDLIYIPFSP